MNAVVTAAGGRPRPASKSDQAMCIVEIAPGDSYAMPLRDGLALMRIMSGAVEAERDWTATKRGVETYLVRSPAHAQLRMIRPDQLIPLKPSTATNPPAKGPAA